MIKKIKIKNYKCIVDLEINFSSTSTALLVGKNAVGKSVIGDVLSVFQAIGQRRGHSRDLIHEKDFSFGDFSNEIYLEISVELNGFLYNYSISFDWPHGSRNARITHENLLQNNVLIFSREREDVNFNDQTFSLDVYFVALPILSLESDSPISVFRTWLTRIVVIAPIPSLMNGVSTKEPIGINRDTSNFADWFVSTLTRHPSIYQIVQNNLTSVFNDFDKIEFRPFNENAKKIIVHFLRDDKKWQVDFEHMSSGEKCLLLCAGLIAAHQTDGPLACFWDEPDNHLSLGEVGHLVMNLRRHFHRRGFLLLTSHKQEVIHSFSNENTFILDREHHMTSTKISLLEDTPFKNHLIESMTLGDISL
jgi:predicted ATPase